jgi:hypothetical protein
MQSGEFIAILCENHMKHAQVYIAFQKQCFSLFKKVIHVSIFVYIYRFHPFIDHEGP